MTAGSFNDIAELEADLWEAADNLRANSKLSSNAYFLPVLGGGLGMPERSGLI